MMSNRFTWFAGDTLRLKVCNSLPSYVGTADGSLNDTYGSRTQPLTVRVFMLQHNHTLTKCRLLFVQHCSWCCRLVVSTCSRTSTFLQTTCMAFLATLAPTTLLVIPCQQTTQHATEGTTFLQTFCQEPATTTSMTSPLKPHQVLCGKLLLSCWLHHFAIRSATVALHSEQAKHLWLIFWHSSRA